MLNKCQPKVHLDTRVSKIHQLTSGQWCINDDTSSLFDAVAVCLDPSNSGITLETDNADAQGLLEVSKGVQYEDVVTYYHTDTSVSHIYIYIYLLKF